MVCQDPEGMGMHNGLSWSRRQGYNNGVSNTMSKVHLFQLDLKMNVLVLLI